MDELEAQGLIPEGTPASGDIGQRLSSHSLDGQDLRNNLDDAVLYVASKVLNKKTGMVDPDKVANFLDDAGNKKLMEIFPDIADDMRDGARFVNAYKIAENRKASLDAKKGPTIQILSRIAGTESVSGEILDIANGKNPVRGLLAITKRINNPSAATRRAMDNAGISIDDMRSGMKSAVLDAAWVNAGGTGGKLNYEAMGQTLFGPMRRARYTSAGNFSSETGAPFMPPARGEGPPPLPNQSLMDVMVKEGIFTESEVDRLKYIIEQGTKIQNAQNAGKLEDVVTDEMGVFMEALLAIAGSTMTTSAVRSTGLRPQGIVEANFGARMFRNFFGDNSKLNQLSILEKAVLDPKYLVELLKKSKSPEQVNEQLTNLNAYLIEAGLRFADDDTATTEDQGSTEIDEIIIRENPGPFTSTPVSSATVPAAPSIPTPPAPVTNVASAQPRPAAQPSVRNRYQQMFPDDLASGIMAALPTRTG